MKNSAVSPELNLKSRYEELADISEYFDSLPPEAQKWMNSYTENFVNASFDKETKSNNLVNFKFIEDLLKKYLKEYKKTGLNNKQVKNFINKYLIREDNVPLQIIKELFFEENEKKQLKLIKLLKKDILANVKTAKKREVNKIVKLIELEVYGINNSRNRCILTKEKAEGALNYTEELTEQEQMISSEDSIIEYIDKKSELEERLNNFDDSDDDSDDSSQ